MEAALSVKDWRPVSDMLLIKIQAVAVNTTTDSSGGQENVLEVSLKWRGTVQKVNDTAGHLIGLLEESDALHDLSLPYLRPSQIINSLSRTKCGINCRLADSDSDGICMCDNSLIFLKAT